jgi:hypothetical protein
LRRIAPPQAEQVSMSMLNTRFSRCAQVIEARRSAGVLSSVSAAAWALAPLPRRALVTSSPVGAVRGEHTVEAGEIDARFGHQRGQPRDEIQRTRRARAWCRPSRASSVGSTPARSE